MRLVSTSQSQCVDNPNGRGFPSPAPAEYPFSMSDPFNLSRFVHAQESAYAAVLQELRAGRKATHWMWFIFPQLRGLGSSPTTQRYAISGLPEAQAFLQHSLLGQRLRECTELVMQIHGRSITDIFGFPDDRKFHSCVTLFSEVGSSATVFSRALAQFFDSTLDQQTISLLRSEGPAPTNPNRAPVKGVGRQDT
jgi:uncharacterized protein (DUF1810 family)